MIKLINKAFRERPRSIHHDRQKARIILRNDANLIVDIVEFYDVDMALKSGNLNARMTKRLSHKIAQTAAFSLEIVQPVDSGSSSSRA